MVDYNFQLYGIKHVRRIEIFLAIEKEDKNSSTNWRGPINDSSFCFDAVTKIKLPVRNDLIQKNRNSKWKWNCFRINVLSLAGYLQWLFESSKHSSTTIVSDIKWFPRHVIYLWLHTILDTKYSWIYFVEINFLLITSVCMLPLLLNIETHCLIVIEYNDGKFVS